jgi:hypothetical protein
MGQNRQSDRQAKAGRKVETWIGWGRIGRQTDRQKTGRKMDRMGQTGKGSANKHKNGQEGAE